VATFTVVGTSTIEDVTDGSKTVPLPAGTIVGDLIVVGFWQGFGGSVAADSRLTPINRTMTTEGGGYGFATDLSDVALTFTDGYFGVAVVVVLRLDGLAPGGTGSANILATEVFGDVAGHMAAVAFVSDYGDDTVSVGSSADWDTQDQAHADDGGTGTDVRCFTYLGVDPVPALDVSIVGSGTSTVNRGYTLLLLEIAAVTTRSYLRQRQSPRANPRVSLNRPTLKQRQYIP